MENVSQKNKRHDKRVTKTNERSIAPFNYSDRNYCPINGSCRLKMWYTAVLSPSKKSQRNMLTLALLRVIGRRAM